MGAVRYNHNDYQIMSEDQRNAIAARVEEKAATFLKANPNGDVEAYKANAYNRLTGKIDNDGNLVGGGYSGDGKALMAKDPETVARVNAITEAHLKENLPKAHRMKAAIAAVDEMRKNGVPAGTTIPNLAAQAQIATAMKIG